MKFVLENVYDKPKLQTTETVVSSPCTGQPDEWSDEQQQQQPENNSSDNAETAPCLIPFSHPELRPHFHDPREDK